MVSDPYQQCYAALVSLVQNEPTLYDPGSSPASPRTLIFEKNFIHYDVAQPFPDKTRIQVGDTPYLILDEDTEDDSGMGSSPRNRTFGGCNDKMQSSINYAFYLVGPDARITLISNLRWALKVALRKGGRNLGIPGVASWKWSSRTFITNNLKLGATTDALNSWRRVCRIVVSVSFSIDGQSIVT